MYDGVGLCEHVEEVELRDGLAVGHGNALQSDLDCVVDVLPDQVAHQDAQDLGRVGGKVLGPEMNFLDSVNLYSLSGYFLDAQQK